MKILYFSIIRITWAINQKKSNETFFPLYILYHQPWDICNNYLTLLSFRVRYLILDKPESMWFGGRVLSYMISYFAAQSSYLIIIKIYYNYEKFATKYFFQIYILLISLKIMLQVLVNRSSSNNSSILQHQVSL